MDNEVQKAFMDACDELHKDLEPHTARSLNIQDEYEQIFTFTRRRILNTELPTVSTANCGPLTSFGDRFEYEWSDTDMFIRLCREDVDTAIAIFFPEDIEMIWTTITEYYVDHEAHYEEKTFYRRGEDE